MLGSFSIFLKFCPECAGEVAVAAERCACGHAFESDRTRGLTPEELVLRDEELYENYLVARVEQARQAVHDAEFALAEDPGNLMKTQTAELLREAAASMGSNLSAQRGKVEALRRMVEAARPKPAPVAPPPVMIAPPRSPAVAAGAASKPATVVAEIMESKPDVRPPKPATPGPTRPNPAAQTAPAPREPSPPASGRSIREPVASKAPAPPPTAPVPGSGPPPVLAAKAAQVLSAIRQARLGGKPAPDAEAGTPKPAASPPRRASTRPQAAAAVTATVPESFRAEQAARAEQAMRKQLDQKGNMDRPSWDCPNCTARVPANSAQCGCGYPYHAGTNDLPSISSGKGKFTALTRLKDRGPRGN